MWDWEGEVHILNLLEYMREKTIVVKNIVDSMDLKYFGSDCELASKMQLKKYMYDGT